MGANGDTFWEVTDRIILPYLGTTDGAISSAEARIASDYDTNNNTAEYGTVAALFAAIVSGNHYYRRLLEPAQIGGPDAVSGHTDLVYDNMYQGAIDISHGVANPSHDYFSFHELQKYGWWSFASPDGFSYGWEPINHPKQIILSPNNAAGILRVRLNEGVIGAANVGGFPPSAEVKNFTGGSIIDPGYNNHDTPNIHHSSSTLPYYFEWFHTATLPKLDAASGALIQSNVQLPYRVFFGTESELGGHVNMLQQIYQASRLNRFLQAPIERGEFLDLEGVGEITTENMFCFDLTVDPASYEGDAWGQLFDVIKGGWFSWTYREGFASKLHQIRDISSRFFCYEKAAQGIAYYLPPGVRCNIRTYTLPQAVDWYLPAIWGTDSVPIVNTDHGQHFP